ncbi:hypothetical protein ACI3KW_00820 [Devosia sp. ZW T5_3]|uniref:hypothetical protein n=1 Tax=Devosia sp. ZW T5_3 TaxID=3378085 RepID=UPI0038535F38
MADQAKLQAQRSDGNIFAFRRLKWGDPPERFHVRSVLCRRIGAPIEPLPALLDDDKVQDGDAVTAKPSTEIFRDSSVADLDERRMRERFVDTAVWGAAIVSVSALTVALIWTGWGK